MNKFNAEQQALIDEAEGKYSGIHTGFLPETVENDQPEYEADFARWKAAGVVPTSTGWRLVSECPWHNS